MLGVGEDDVPADTAEEDEVAGSRRPCRGRRRWCRGSASSGALGSLVAKAPLLTVAPLLYTHFAVEMVADANRVHERRAPRGCREEQVACHGVPIGPRCRRPGNPGTWRFDHDAVAATEARAHDGQSPRPSQCERSQLRPVSQSREPRCSLKLAPANFDSTSEYAAERSTVVAGAVAGRSVHAMPRMVPLEHLAREEATRAGSGSPRCSIAW